ncbi:lysophosphatidic acid receptor 4-like isoform X2 [Macrobrachium nipponense]|uniref:lysophosphatidic acid receptor 4-like isoform X2 n=1 Tax=Macrobrachium nipponense TaxID=159736 RepID=UPI0030C849A7
MEAVLFLHSEEDGGNSTCNYTASRCCESNLKPENWSLVLGMFVTFFVIVVGTSGNLMTLCTLAHQFSMRRRHRFIKDFTADTVFITNLAIADLFYSAINLPFIFTTYYRIYNEECPWKVDSLPCKVSAFLRYANAISEWMTLGLMALERSVCIYKYRSHQGKSKWFTRNKAILYCVLIWSFGLLCQVHTLTSEQSFSYNEAFVKCDFIEERPRLLFFAIESLVPCILILIGYIVILCQIYSKDARILLFTVTRGGPRQKEGLRRSRTTRVILMLLFVYLICVIPLCAYNIGVGTLKESDRDTLKDLGIVIYCLYWCQYFINNFIYVVSNEKYRKAYCQFLALVTRRQVQLPATTTTHPRSIAQRNLRGRHHQSVFSITNSSNNFLSTSGIKVRTISECEERHRDLLVGDYQLQYESRASSFCSPLEVSTCSVPLPLPYSQKNCEVILRRWSLPKCHSFSS